MEIESFIEVGEKLSNLWDEISRLLDSDDHVAQAKALVRGREIVKEFEWLKAGALATITALLNRSDLGSGDERATSLTRGFEFGARLADTLHDEFRDIADGETKVVRLTDSIVRDLNAISPGRIRLAVLLDHPDPGVRSLACTYLIDLMPERAISVLKEVREVRRGRSAGMRALTTLFGWEHGRVSRCSSLTK
jgi:hypothetical protein